MGTAPLFLEIYNIIGSHIMQSFQEEVDADCLQDMSDTLAHPLSLSCLSAASVNEAVWYCAHAFSHKSPSEHVCTFGFQYIAAEDWAGVMLVAEWDSVWIF